MGSINDNKEVTFEFPPFIRVYKDGHMERILEPKFTPPSSLDPATNNVSSKDVIIDSKTGLSARLYLPQVIDSQSKLPLLIYIHGGGFCIESAFSPLYHSYLNSLVAEANVVAISIEYRRAPDYLIPICYEDSWSCIEWVVSQSEKEEWFKKYVDFERVFIAGDSAGGNITHNMAIRAGCFDLKGFKIKGIALIHPYFAKELVGDEVGDVGMEREGKFWKFICPLTTGLDDPLACPHKDPNISTLGCEKVLVCVAEKDGLRDRGWFYYQNLGKSGWNGVLDFMETEGENHVFHLFNPTSEKAGDLMKRLVSFINTSE